MANITEIHLSMPITKSARKAMRQTYTRSERNKATRSKVKTYVKKVLVLSKSDLEKAKKVLPTAYSAIDTACKKNILHKNNAGRKKSLLAKAIAAAEQKK